MVCWGLQTGSSCQRATEVQEQVLIRCPNLFVLQQQQQHFSADRTLILSVSLSISLGLLRYGRPRSTRCRDLREQPFLDALARSLPWSTHSHKSCSSSSVRSAYSRVLGLFCCCFFHVSRSGNLASVSIQSLSRGF